MNYCMTGLNEYGLMAVAGTVKEVKDNVVTLTVTENMKQADGKWADVQRTIECDVTKAGGADGVEKGMDFCALGHGIPTEGGNMEMTAKAFGTGNCRIEVTEQGTGRSKTPDGKWEEKKAPYVFGMVMGDALYQTGSTKNGADMLTAQFHIEEPYEHDGETENVLVSDKVKFMARSDEASKAQFNRYVNCLEKACDKAGLEMATGAQHKFERHPFKSVFVFREDAEKYKANRFAQIQSFTAEEGVNQGNTYYYRSEFMYRPDFANFGRPDIEAIKAREESVKAYNDDKTIEEAPVESKDGFVPATHEVEDLFDPSINPFEVPGMDYSDK